MVRHASRLCLIAFVLATPAAAQPDAPQRELTLDALFPHDRVLDVRIRLPKRDWNRLRMQNRSFNDAIGGARRRGEFRKPFSYFLADVEIDGVSIPKVGIRKKGFIGSLSTERPSLKLKLNHAVPNRRIEGLNNLTLNNNQQDESLASQFLGYAIFRAAGLPAPRCAFAKVSVNGKNLGIYCHVESLRKPLLDRTFGNADGVVYEGTVVDFFDHWARGFEPKRGDEARGMTAIERTIASLDNASDEELETRLARTIDLDAFYRFWAMESLIGFWDGYSGNQNNYFLYLHPETERFHFLPWGADMMFTVENPMGRDPDAPFCVQTKGRLAHRLYQLESGKRKYRRALETLLADHWDEKKLLAETNRIESLLKDVLGPSQRRAFDRLDDVREFIEDRREQIEAEIKDGMPEWTKPSPPPFAMPQPTPGSIWSCAYAGDVAGLQRCIDAGVDLNTRSIDDGSTAIACAAVAGHEHVVEFLLAHDADPDIANFQDDVPLHSAAFFGRLEIVRALVDHGASLTPENWAGDTPLDAAATPWNREIARMVEFVGFAFEQMSLVGTAKRMRPKVADFLRERGAKGARNNQK